MSELATVSVELLGRPRVVVKYEDGREEESDKPKLARCWLLLAVVLQGERERDELTEILWDGVHDRADSFNQVTYQLRQTLGPAHDALESQGSVRLDRDLLPPEVTLVSDIEVFLNPAARKDPALACEAIRLYRGPLLIGCRLDQAGRQWVDGERTRQERQLRSLLALVFPEATDVDLEAYAADCRRGQAGSVADLAEAGMREQEAAQPEKMLRSTQRAPIGVIAPVSAWPTTFYIDLIKGVRNGAESDDPDRRRRILVFDVAREDVDEMDAVVASALEQDVAGLIALNATWSEQTRSIMHKRGSPVVSVMVEDLSPPVCCSVLLDNKPVAELMHEVLVPSDAAVLVTPPPFDPSKRNTIDFARNEKRQTYEDLVAQAGLELAPVRALAPDLAGQTFDPGAAYVVEIDSYETALGQQIFEATAESLPPRTAMIFLNDWQAASFIAACDESGRSAVERGLLVSAYENTEVARWFGISTVDPQLDHIGRLAYERLQEALDHRAAFQYRTEKVRGVVRLRRSTQWAA